MHFDKSEDIFDIKFRLDVIISDKGIGFHVKLSGGSSRQKSGRAIKFGSITSNVGNNYKSSTGSFTAPFDGMYFLTTTITIKDSSGIFQMMKNNIIISECKTGKYEKNQMPSVTMSAVVSLRKGDSVFQLEVNKGILSWFKQSRVLDGPASFFSGFLVSRYVL